MPSSDGMGPDRPFVHSHSSRQICEVSESWRDRPGHRVVVEVQLPQVGEVAEFGWYRAGQIRSRPGSRPSGWPGLQVQPEAPRRVRCGTWSEPQVCRGCPTPAAVRPRGSCCEARGASGRTGGPVRAESDRPTRCATGPGAPGCPDHRVQAESSRRFRCRIATGLSSLSRRPSSSGIVPLRPLRVQLPWLSRWPWRRTQITRPTASVRTPCHCASGSSVSQLSLLTQLGPSVAL